MTATTRTPVRPVWLTLTALGALTIPVIAGWLRIVMFQHFVFDGVTLLTLIPFALGLVVLCSTVEPRASRRTHGD